MQLTDKEMKDVLKIAAAFKAAHAEHPDSRSLPALHERFDRIWRAVKPMLVDSQVAEIEAAAAPKNPPTNDG